MMELFIYLYMIFFSIVYSVFSGGFNFRIRYAYKVSDSVLEFIKNYYWSYSLTYKQIKNGYKFIPEVNSKLEKLLALALENKVGVGYSTDWRNDGEKSLRIQKERLLDNSNETVRFEFQSSCINGEAFILSPSVFFLAQKVYNNLIAEENSDKAERRKTVI